MYNLRGNQRTAGELSRQEGGKVFGAGSRATVAIVFLVKTGNASTGGGPGRLLYRDIGDYLSREQKLDIVDHGFLDSIEWQALSPNDHGDWINPRRDDFDKFAPIGDKNRPSVFSLRSSGLKTNRDPWSYGSERADLSGRLQSMIDYYEDLRVMGRRAPETVETARISWTDTTRKDLARGRALSFDEAGLRTGTYRPFFKQHVYFDADLNERRYQLPKIFPTRDHANIGICVTGVSSHYNFTPFIADCLPDLHLLDTGQFFPRYTYGRAEDDGGFDFGEETDDHGYRRLDNITDTALKDYRATYGGQVSKDDIFYYVYGLLHSPTYRSEFAADLKKMLPRIPKVCDLGGFAEAGRALADLHLHYEIVEPYPLDEIVIGSGAGDRLYRVQKMVFAKGPKGRDRTRIVYNSRITVAGIPEAAYRYQLGSRSAVEWIMDRYQVRTDKPSGIVNDPNDWAVEHGEPRYILDLLKRIVTVSIETMKVIDSLPPLDIIEGK